MSFGLVFALKLSISTDNLSIRIDWNKGQQWIDQNDEKKKKKKNEAKKIKEEKRPSHKCK